MIYDCFIFNDEFELLEIRLNTVMADVFVLVEGTKTHSGKPKELHFNKRKKEFEQFNIVHIVVNDYPDNPAYFENENIQRNAITKGLINCKSDDIILISDVDEIPILNKLPKDLGLDYYAFVLQMYYYSIDLQGGIPWNGTVACRYEAFKTPQYSRDRRVSPNQLILNGGWHFSWVGNNEKIIKKAKEFAHTELDTDLLLNDKNINSCIEKGLLINGFELQLKHVEPGEHLPAYLYNNLERFSELIRPRTK